MKQKIGFLFSALFCAGIFLFFTSSKTYAQTVAYCPTQTYSCTGSGGGACSITDIAVGTCSCGYVCTGGLEVGNSGCPKNKNCALCDAGGDAVCGETQTGSTGSSYSGDYNYEYESQYSYQYEGEPDLDITGLSFFDSTGTQRASKQFDPMEQIYLRIKITNIGDGFPCCWTKHAVYKNSPGGDIAHSIASDIPMYFSSSYLFYPGDTATYESWKGGVLSSRFTKPYFIQQVPNTYTLRVFADYSNILSGASEELTDLNNQTSVTYTILPPDLVVSAYDLLDASGSARGAAGKPPFFTSDRIYPRVTLANTGTGRANTKDGIDKTYSYIYPNRAQTIPSGDTTGGLVLMKNGIFNPGYSKQYAPFPIGPNSPAFIATNYWNMWTAGSYTSTAFINFNSNAVEGNYANNQRSVAYTVVTPYSISGKVCIDANENATCDSGEQGFAGAVISVSGGPTFKYPEITAADGTYKMYPLQAGAYTVTVTIPAAKTPDYRLSAGTPTNRAITIASSNQANVNFGVIGKFSVSGNQFVDANNDGIKNGAETNYTSSLPTVSWTSKPASASSNPVVFNNADGSYSVKNLTRGKYKLAYAPPTSAGFSMVYPLPPQYTVTINPTCAGTIFDGTKLATCASAPDTAISNQNFAISQNSSWLQVYGSDIRFDQGFSNAVPLTVNAACPSSASRYTLAQVAGGSAPGIVFSGANTPSFGLGAASATNWQLGGSAYGVGFKPVNQNILRTSYDYVQTSMRQQGLVATDLTTHSTCSNLASCTIGNTLPDGVYQANGDVALNSITLPATGTHQYVILVNGKLNINTTIDVPQGQSLVFIVKDDIVVLSSIGTTPPPATCPAPPSIEGLFSTDSDFIIDGANNCPTVDKMLAMEGSIVVNANYSGGTFQNKRNLCGSNAYPSFTIKDRPDILLNIPSILRVPTYTWQEVAP